MTTNSKLTVVTSGNSNVTLEIRQGIRDKNNIELIAHALKTGLTDKEFNRLIDYMMYSKGKDAAFNLALSLTKLPGVDEAVIVVPKDRKTLSVMPKEDYNCINEDGTEELNFDILFNDPDENKGDDDSDLEDIDD